MRRSDLRVYAVQLTPGGLCGTFVNILGFNVAGEDGSQWEDAGGGGRSTQAESG